MFIYCFDDKLKEELIKYGYKQAQFPTNSNYSVFILNNKISFDFSKFDNNKYKIQNKIIF